MSIYPVPLNEWFPKGDEMYETTKCLVESIACYKCGKKKIQYRYSIGHHSLPWGYGDVWCSKKCFNKKEKK